MPDDYVKNIAIAGASGNLGKPLLDALLAEERFNITIIARQESTASFPNDPSITVYKGDLQSHKFLTSAFKGQEVFINILSFWMDSAKETTFKMFDAAAEAGVKYFLPNDFGSDNGNPKMTDALSRFAGVKIEIRDYLQQKGMNWIGIVNNPWTDYCITHGIFLIDHNKLKATIATGPTAKFNTTTVTTVASAVSKIFSLPKTSNAGPSLSSYANSYVYLSSFRTTQTELLAAVQRATGTTPNQWTIEYKDVDELFKEGNESVTSGSDAMGGFVKILMGATFRDGMGGDYESIRKLANEELGLPEENLDDVVRQALESCQGKNLWI